MQAFFWSLVSGMAFERTVRYGLVFGKFVFWAVLK